MDMTVFFNAIRGRGRLFTSLNQSQVEGIIRIIKAGGNIENATRQQLKKLLVDPKFRRGMTEEELAAAKKAVLGTPAQNLLRLAGKLSPQGNGLMLTGNAALSATAPAIGIPVALGAYGAKKAAEGMTARNVKALQALVASGGKAAQNTAKALPKSITDTAHLLVQLGLIKNVRDEQPSE